MHYKKFVIHNYRAITGPLEIDISKKSLIPIIGINESGKTTVLHALFAFDHYNDTLNDEGRHLKDTSNLYRTSSPPAIIEAEVSMTHAELSSALTRFEKANETLKTEITKLRRKRALSTDLCIKRNLKTQKYTLNLPGSFSAEFQDALARSLISSLPYILFFDDFRDKVEEKIEIVPEKERSASGWIAIIEQLFKQTDKSLSVFNLPKLEERQRKTIIAKVQRRLNETLTREWQNFRLDDRDALDISIEFVQENTSNGTPRYFIKLEVVETDVDGDQHFFFISDRSKGFYWFFNFVMKLEFNPKLVADGGNTIYLLDEPGSYLHAFAQRKLCAKLRQLSERNKVIYCTHSHYLLDPETIPVSSITVADKDGNGNVALMPITNYKGAGSDRRSALQPVLDALQIKPFVLDLIHTRTTVITEGIYDYFALELFRDNRAFSILPSVGAGSIKYYISLLIAWQVNFRALWDNDTEGRKWHDDARTTFGEEISEHCLRLLPSKNGTKKIIQDMFDGTDMTLIRTELGLPTNCSFERTIQALFYSPQRTEVVRKLSPITRANFEEIYTTLSLS